MFGLIQEMVGKRMSKVLAPCQQFFCDTCGEVIESPSDGYVEFSRDEAHLMHNFNIVHDNTRCRQDLGSSYSLERFLGRQGIGLLSSWIHVGPITDTIGRDRSEYKSVIEFAEFFKRLQLPYYEQARRYLMRAAGAGYIDGNATGSHDPQRLESIVTIFLEEDEEDNL